MSKINDIYQALLELTQESGHGADASQISRKLGIDRTTASRYLNELVRQEKAIKTPGKPVQFRVERSRGAEDHIRGAGKSLKPVIEQAMAALLYPEKPLDILLTGETGTGKTYLAETLSKIAKERRDPTRDLPFVILNCADYAQNAELLVGQIFGIKEGAFTGATQDQSGLVEQADGGILFLDEIHRLPPSGQEMLFYLMDKGIYHRLGEATVSRHANVTLIGATTEPPRHSLLPALYRRFSFKLHLPPLRKRTREEKEELLNHFLAEEAGKMNQPLSITDNSREALISHPCPGNIGQLKSDIQIACANAYLRYLNREQEKILITIKDLPDDVRSYSKESQHQLEIKTIDTRETTTQNQQNHFTLPNIYQRLSNQSDPKRLQEIINTYIRELTQKYHQPHTKPQNGWEQLIDPDLLQALKKAPDELNDQLPMELPLTRLYVIGLHLQNYRNHQQQNNPKETLPAVIHPNPSHRKTAQVLARYLKQETGLTLPDEEIELLAHFLPEKEQHPHGTTGSSVAILVVTHGNAAASSMADVTNTLLGNKVVHAIDMPLNQSATAIYQQVKEKIKSMDQGKGVLLLVDIGSLITLGDTLQHDLDIPVKTLPGVNLPMVLEAGRKSLIDLNLDNIYHAAKNAMTSLTRENHDETNIDKKRMIATVCFTGEGAASLLETWLKNRLSPLDPDVVIRTVRIDPVKKDTTVLNDLKHYYDLIAIIGTVPVSIESIPYIPAWELLDPDGISRLIKLLEVTRKTPKSPDRKDGSEKNIFHLATKGLAEIVTYINPKTLATILKQHLPLIGTFYSWDKDRELGMWMHLGSLMDRLVSARVKNHHEKLEASIPLDGNIRITDQEKELWMPLLSALEKRFSIKIPDPIVKELIKLSR